jgi:hypothetical protein
MRRDIEQHGQILRESRAMHPTTFFAIRPIPTTNRAWIFSAVSRVDREREAGRRGVVMRHGWLRRGQGPDGGKRDVGTLR